MGFDVVMGSYRPDIILGRGGSDSISDGDERGDSVWANDTLVGGDGEDLFFAGRGNDTIWGGNEGEEIDQAGNGEDQISYLVSGAARITLTFNGTQQDSNDLPFLTAASADIDTDTLYAIERIVLTDETDYFYYSGSIPEDYRLTIDFAGGEDDVLNGGQAAEGMEVLIDAQGNGTLSDTEEPTLRHIDLLHVHTQIIGSAYDDTITDSAAGGKRIDGGAGDDAITVGGNGSLVYGGAGDDMLQGGDGCDLLVGGAGNNALFGGGGTDILICGAGAASEADVEMLDGGAGSDLLLSTGSRPSVTMRGGGGNDVIDARLNAAGVTLEFGAGDGRDTIEGEGWQGGDPTLENADFSWSFGVAAVDFTASPGATSPSAGTCGSPTSRTASSTPMAA
jgi:Ca2+-binding RTX toxin-like protein